MNRKLFALMTALAVIAGLFTPLAPQAVAPQAVQAAASNWCLAGDLNGWDNASTPLYDDGTHGDLVSGDDIFSLDYTVASAGRAEWKIVKCGDWSTAYPSANAWLNTGTASQVVKFTFDVNDHSSDAGTTQLPTQNIVNAWDTLPTTFTAVGDFNSWNNADPATALTALGNGIYRLAYIIPTAGSYIGKVTTTGSWDAFGADGRSKDAANISFTTTAPNETVIFLLDANTGRVTITPNGSGTGSWCLAGDFQGWDNASDPLYDDGSHGDLLGGDGVFTLDYEIGTAARNEWKIFQCGSWSPAYPSQNAWVNTSVVSQTVKFTFDTNDHSGDAGTTLYPTQNIVNAWDTLPASFTAVGDFQGWDNANTNTALTDEGNGWHKLEYAIASAGSYIGKIATTGSWDAFSTDGRNKDAPNFSFDVYQDGDEATFLLDTFNGRMTIIETPPPSHASHDNNVWWDDLGHNSRELLYRTPGGAVETNTAVKLRLRAASGDLTAAKVRVWNDRTDTQMLLDMAIAADDGTYEWWEATVPASAAPTIYWYRFIAIDGTATAYYEDDAGLTGGWGQTFAESQDNSWQITVYDPDYETPDWAKDAVIYQIFPDRFRDGDESNDPLPGSFHYNLPDGSIYRSTIYTDTDWNTPLCDPRDASGDCPNKYGENFYGGDLQGITDKLDNLQDLGVTALYLNPVFESPSNHKYDTTDYGTIDDAFGDLSTFITLTTEAHNRGMKVILDGVFNHTSSDSIYFDRYGRYTEVGACESQNSPYRDWYYFTDVEAGTGECVGSDGTPNAATYESWFGYDSLPKLDASNAEVRALIWDSPTGIAPAWLHYADGWRLDVAGDVDPGVTGDPTNDYWEGFRAAVRAANPGAYIIGEEWGNSTPWLLGDEWDASMNYQFGSALMSFWRDEPFTDNDHNSESSAGPLNPISPSQLDERLHYLEERYPPEAFYAMMNLLDSHDTNRALFLLDHNADQNDRSLYENPAYDWSDAITRLKGVALLQFTLPGAPTIYYGDEVGLVAPPTYSGGKWEDDPYNRIPYPWLDETGTPFYTRLQTQIGQDAVRDYYELLTGARNSHAALRTGSFDTLLVDDDAKVYVYGRKMDDNSDAAIVIANRDTALQTVAVDVSGYLNAGAVFTDVLNSGANYTVAADGVLTVTNVPGMGGALLVLSGALQVPPDAVSDLAVTAEASQELALGWSAAAGADSYDIYRSLLSGGGYEFITNTTTTVYTDTGLTNAINYYYVIVSKDDTTLLTSADSNEASGMPHDIIGWANLQWPHEITHTVGITPTENIYGQVYITGVTSATGATEGLMAQVGLGSTTSAPSTWLDWVDATFNGDSGSNDEFKGQLVPEEVGEYYYIYRYSTTGGRDWVYADESGIISATGVISPGLLHVQASSDVTPTAAPQNLAVIHWGADHITTQWDAVSDGDLYAYELYRYGEGETTGDAVKVARVFAPATVYTDTGVTTDQTYTYTVQALDTSFNKSAFSNEASGIAEARLVALHFRVTVPDFTPSKDTVYIAGDNADVLGGFWSPNAQPITRLGVHEWGYDTTAAEGTALNYKYTRGSWDVVENWGTLVGLTNRQLTVSYGATGVLTVTDTVHNWRDPLVVATYPEEGALAWNVTRPISATFNRELQTTLVNSTTFILTDFFDGTVYSGTFTFGQQVTPFTDPIFGSGNITGTVVLFTPTTPLTTTNGYLVALTKEGYVDEVPMQSDYVWDFGVRQFYLPLVFKSY